MMCITRHSLQTKKQCGSNSVAEGRAEWCGRPKWQNSRGGKTNIKLKKGNFGAQKF
jgi:hypothetical protein